MLEARNIFKSFGSVSALEDVDFECGRERSWPSSAITAPASRR